MALNSIRKNGFMASVDLKDAYYSVLISVDDRKFLRFFWGGCLYEYNRLPNGLACAPRLFTKLMKPVMSFLRSKGFKSIIYLDDTFLFGDSVEECSANVNQTVNLFQKLGFHINVKKSVCVPSQTIDILGFSLN